MRNYREGDRYSMLQALNFEHNNTSIGGLLHKLHKKYIRNIVGEEKLLTIRFGLTAQGLIQNYGMHRGFGMPSRSWKKFDATFVLEPNA